MFYIGYTYIEKFMKSFDDYHGSVTSKKYSAIFKQEIKDNPHLFKTIPLAFYSTKEEAIEKEGFLQKSLNVVYNDMYINMSISTSRIFHNPGGGHSEKTK